ncbi:MAG: hypothetical protein IPH31_21320 [Lewinellaceae bacterium]|nr:hypothetical protein [Lewinellaceae bacterium]
MVNGALTQTISNLTPGQYDVTVSDRNECIIVGGVYITEPPDVAVNLIDVLDLICNGTPEGKSCGRCWRAPPTCSVQTVSPFCL